MMDIKKILCGIAVELPVAVARDIITLGGGLTDMKAQTPVTLAKIERDIFRDGKGE